MTDHAFQVRLYKAGALNTSSSNVDVTWTQSQLAEYPIVQDPTVRPLEGRTEAVTWTVRVKETGDDVFSHFTTGDGRLSGLGRIVQCRRSVNGGAYAVIGSGRVSDISLDSNINAWNLDVEDEGYIARNNILFNTTNNTYLYPFGPAVNWGPIPAPAGLPGTCLVNGVRDTENGIHWAALLLFDRWTQAMGQDVAEAIRGDYGAPSAFGNPPFKYLSVRINGTDYRVCAFEETMGNLLPSAGARLSGFEDFMTGNSPLRVWVYTPSSNTFAVNARFAAGYLHMFSGPPSNGSPLWIGGGTTGGIHPMTLKKAIWDGSYQSTASPRVRYSTAAFDNGTTGVLRVAMPKVMFKVTGPATLGTWMQNKINAPLGVVDFTDSSGRLRPRRVWLPNNASISTTQFTAFTSTNLRPPFPSYTHGRTEQITALRYRSPKYFAGYITLTGPPPLSAYTITDSTRTVTHDRATRFGQNTMDVDAEGWPTVGLTISLGGLGSGVDPLVAYSAQEVFDRFGDGPVFGRFAALGAAADSVVPGDYVRLTVSAYPNMQSAGRGGTRLVQVLGKSWNPEGCVCDYLDAGPNLQPLSAPGLTLALSSQDKKHSIIATVTPPAADPYVMVQAAISTTQPTSQSGAWTAMALTATTLGAGKYRIAGRPAGTKTWVRAALAAPGRLRSGWTVGTSGITSSALTAPSALTASNVKAGSATLAWTNGETAYPVEVTVDTSTSASPSTANRYSFLQPRSVQQDLWGLTGNTKHRAWVRHRDAYGGASNTDSTTFTTLTTGSSTNWSVCPPLLGLAVEEGVQV